MGCGLTMNLQLCIYHYNMQLLRYRIVNWPTSNEHHVLKQQILILHNCSQLHSGVLQNKPGYNFGILPVASLKKNTTLLSWREDFLAFLKKILSTK